MNLKVCISCMLLGFGFVVHAQDLPLQPYPQQVKTSGRSITVPAVCALAGEKEADMAAVKNLKALLAFQPAAKGYTVYIGEKGDKSVKKYAKLVPARPEAYYLSVDDKKIVLVGADERGTYYGVKTLAQLLKDNRLPEIEIQDYPDVRFRGVVEGFYGTPWSYADRVSQLHFYGDNKLNTYIYGPKDDPYHSSPNWRLPYPEKEAAQLRELVKIAAQNKVDFVWAIHPGQDIRWDTRDREVLIDKFEKMYRLGVRSFAVFFDDISGEGTDPVRQAELLNYIDDKFVKVKPDVTPLIMCPTEYNKSWSDPAKGYLTTLGTKLNPSVQVMWTGDRVISDITKPGLDWINERIKRPAYVWWNFPVSDYVRDHLLLGPVYGNDTSVAADMAGFVTNPMEHAEASKIAIYSVANYAWNLEKYDSDATWEAAIKNCMPAAAEAFRTFASHNSDLGQNGHLYRRDESVEVKPVASRFLQAYKGGSYPMPEYNRMLQEFEKVTEAADILLVSKDNRALIGEITPWLYQFKLLGQTGQEVLAMAKALEANDPSVFLRKYAHVKALKELSFGVDQTYNQNPYQPGVKAGTLVLQPFIDTVFVEATTRYNTKYNDRLSVETSYCPHKLLGDVPQIKHLPLQIKMNRIVISPLLEVVKWNGGQWVGIQLDKPCLLDGIELNLGVKDVQDWGTLEVSADGGEWEKLPLVQKGSVYKAVPAKVPVQFIRFTNGGAGEREVYLRQFGITLAEK